VLCDIFKQAGLPEGVVNMVFGKGKFRLNIQLKSCNLIHNCKLYLSGPKAGQALVSHPKVPLISFTGGN
jgi:acyl-CoA reductase-like NAD-dependent aldehyde dehydrogenase